MTDEHPIIIIAKDKELDPNIMFCLISKLDFDHYNPLSAKKLSGEFLELKIPIFSFKKTINLLQKKGIILQGPKVKNENTYRLNPNFANYMDNLEKDPNYYSKKQIKS